MRGAVPCRLFVLTTCAVRMSLCGVTNIIRRHALTIFVPVPSTNVTGLNDAGDKLARTDYCVCTFV